LETDVGVYPMRALRRNLRCTRIATICQDHKCTSDFCGNTLRPARTRFAFGWRGLIRALLDAMTATISGLGDGSADRGANLLWTNGAGATDFVVSSDHDEPMRIGCLYYLCMRYDSPLAVNRVTGWFQ
jgi:hypothetical protein